MAYPTDKETFRRVINRNLSAGEPGTTLDENDQNLPADFLERLQDTLGLGIKMGYASVKAFFDYVKTEVDKVIDKFDKAGGTVTGDINITYPNLITLQSILPPLSGGLLRIYMGQDNTGTYFTDSGVLHNLAILSFKSGGGYIQGINSLKPESNKPLCLWVAGVGQGIIIENKTSGQYAYLNMSEGNIINVNEIDATGDIEVSDANKGYILKDRTTATRYRLKVDSGVLSVEAVV